MKKNIIGLNRFSCVNNECDFILDITNEDEFVFYRKSIKSDINNFSTYYGMDYIKLEAP